MEKLRLFTFLLHIKIDVFSLCCYIRQLMQSICDILLTKIYLQFKNNIKSIFKRAIHEFPLVFSSNCFSLFNYKNLLGQKVEKEKLSSMKV
jgi:hypothetical protein